MACLLLQQEILRPFLLVCESKNPRLIGIVLGSIQKLLAHNAVSDEGRTQIIQALQQVCVCVRVWTRWLHCGVQPASPGVCVCVEGQSRCIALQEDSLSNSYSLDSHGQMRLLHITQQPTRVVCSMLCLYTTAQLRYACMLAPLAAPPHLVLHAACPCACACVQVEKSSDDTVKLKILQTALTHLQNPRNVDDKVRLNPAFP